MGKQPRELGHAEAHPPGRMPQRLFFLENLFISKAKT
jgi:hypothetical protein